MYLRLLETRSCLAQITATCHLLACLLVLLTTATAIHGQQLFQTYGIPGSNEIGSSIAVLPNGNVVVGGSHGNLAAVTVFDQLGQPLWSRSLPAPDSYRQFVESIIVTPDGFIAGVGNTVAINGSDYRHNGFVFKMDQNGNLLWRHSESHPQQIYFDKIVAVNNGTYLVSCGYQNLGTYLVDVALATFDANTGLLSALSPRFNMHNNFLLDDPSGLTVAPNGDYYVTGRTYLNGASTNSMRPYILCLNPAFNLVWSKYYLVPAAGSARLYPTNMIFSGNGLVISTFGDRLSNSSNYTTGLFKVDQNGNMLWGKDYDIPSISQETNWSLTENALGYVIVGRTNTNKIFVLQTDHNGDHLWTRLLDANLAGLSVDPFGSTCSFANGNVWFTGHDLQPTRQLVLGNIDASGAVNCATAQAISPILFTYSNFDAPVAATPAAETLPTLSNTSTQSFNYPPICTNLGTPNLGPDTTSCTGIFVLDGTTSGATQYVWQDGSTNATLNVTSPGTYWVTASNGCCFASDTITISIGTASVSLGPDLVLCNGASGTLNAGPGMSSYLWSTGQSTSSISVTTAGTYSVTATSTGGCQAIDTVMVQASNPSVALGPDTAFCLGGSLALNAGNPGAIYQWSTGATTQSITASTTGNYSVTVTDPLGCTASDGVFILVSNPSVNLGPDDTICGTGSLVLNAGNPGSNYSWSNGAVTPSITVTAAGNYAVTITDTVGCMASDAIFLDFSNPVVNIGPDTTVCGNVPFPIDAGSPWSSYAWSNGATTQTVTLAYSGTFTVTVTDSLGCDATDAMVLRYGSVEVDLGPDTTMCGIGSLVIDAGLQGVTYLWSTGATSQTITVSTTGAYILTATDTVGCIGADTLVFQISDPQVDLGPDTIICSYSTLLIDPGIAGVTYIWSNGATTQTITTALGGNYSVTVTDPYGCTAADDMLLSIDSFAVLLGPDTIFCNADSVLLDAGGQGQAFIWSNGATSPSITVLGTGEYSVTATDAQGCIASDTVQAEELPPPPLSLGPDIELCGENGIELKSSIVGLGYLWSNGATTPTIFADSSLAYWLVVQTDCGIATDTIVVELQREAQLFVPNAFTPNADGLNDRFEIQGFVREGYELQVYDRWGKLLYVSNAPTDAWDGRFQGKDCPEGAYFYRLSMVGCDQKLHSRGGSVTLLR